MVVSLLFVATIMNGPDRPEATRPEPKKERSAILRFFEVNPWFGLIGFLGAVASIIALGLGMWPWLTAAKRELTYCINPVRTRMVQATESSDIGVTYKGLPVNGNVTVAQIAVWNAGREPIRREDILSPVQLHLHNPNGLGVKVGTNGTMGCKILDASIVKASRPEIMDFTMKRLLNDSMVTTNLTIVFDWRICEMGDGALIQIVYGGNPEAQFELFGAVVGQSHPKQLVKAQGTLFNRIKIDVGLMLIASLITIIAARIATDRSRHGPRSAGILILFWVYLVGQTVFMTYALINFMTDNSQSIITPFGF